MKNLLLGFLISISSVSVGQSIESLIQSEYIAKPETAEGHPYLFEEYSTGNLKFSTGGQENVMIRFNLADNNLVARLSGKEFILRRELIDAFTLQETSGGKNYSFVPLRIGTKQCFVELLYDSNGTKLVKWYRKQFMKGQPQPGYASFGNSPDRFEQTLMYMFVINDRTIEVPKKKDQVIEVLSQNNEELKIYIAEIMKKKKLKIGEEGDIITLLEEIDTFVKSNP